MDQPAAPSAAAQPAQPGWAGWRSRTSPSRVTADPATSAVAAAEAPDGVESPDGRPGAPAPARHRRRWWAGPPAGTVTVAELLGLAGATVVGVVATMSLATAHLGVHGLPTVLGSSLVVLVVLAVLARIRAAAFPRVVLDPVGMLPAVAGGGLALWMFLPGFHYAAGDKDPGSYVEHAVQIARGHSISFHDTLLGTPGLPVQLTSPGARFPAVWIEPGHPDTIFMQFYHLWPSLLATSYDAGGFGAIVATTPLLGAAAVVLTVLVARRFAGVVASWAAALLMTTNMMQVWQAKYPTTEVLCEVLFVGALLAVVVSVQTGWRWPALVGGLLLTMGYLGRPDGILLVLFAAGILALLWVVRRFDARAWWFAAGLVIPLPYAFWQAYGPAYPYTHAADVPGLTTMVGLLAVCAVGAAVLRPLLAGLVRRIGAALDRRPVRLRVGTLVTLGAVGLFVLGGLRPRLFGADYMYYGARLIRSYDEINLRRLAWFFTWPGLILVVAGVGVVALRRRWTGMTWLLTVLTVGLLTLYCWHARNSPYFMWVGRRFVPAVLPGMFLLMAIALAAAWALKVRGRLRLGVPAAIALLAFIVGVQASQSLPLRSHDEWAGSYGVNQSIAALAGDQKGIYLWAPANSCCVAPVTLFGPTVWLLEDQDSALLPTDPAKVSSYVQTYARTFPDRPLFVVYPTSAVVPRYPGLNRIPAGRFAGTMPHWIESSISRPNRAQQIPYDFTVYRVTSAS